MNLLGILTSLTGLVAIVSSCSERQLTLCTNQLLEDVSITREDLKFGLLLPVSRQSLTKLCRDYVNLDSCVTTSRSNCPDLIRAELEGIEKSVNYICGDGFETHLKYRSCWSITDLRWKVGLCMFAIREPEDEECDTYRTFIKCMSSNVEEACGSEAAEHQVKIEKKALQPIASLIDCDLDPLNWKLILGITFGVLGVIILAIVILCVCCCVRRKNKKRRQDEENRIHEMNVVTQPGAVAPTYPNYMQAQLCHPKLQKEMESGEGGGKGWGGGGGVDNPMYPSLPGKE